MCGEVKGSEEIADADADAETGGYRDGWGSIVKIITLVEAGRVLT